MAIDASIYQLANKPTVALQDPTDSMAKALQMQGMVAQNQIQQQGIQDANEFRNKYGMSPGMAKNVKDLQTGQYQAEHAKSLALNEHLKSMEGLAGQQNTVYQAALDALNQDPAAAPAIHQATLAKTAQNAQQLGIDTSVSNDPKGFVAPAASLPPEAGPDIAQPSPTWDVDQQKQWLKQKISETTPESVRTKLAELAIQQQKADAENWQLQPVQGGFIRYNKKSGEVQPVEGGYRPLPTVGQVQLSLAGSNSGGDFSQPLPDAGREAKAQAIFRGEAPMLEESSRAPGNREVNNRAAALAAAAGVPLGGKNQVNLNYKALSDFEGNGKANTTIRALNTMTEHVATARRMAQALDNGNIPLFNQLSQALSKATGQAPVTNFDTLKEFLAGEVASVAQGGHITEGGITKAADSIRTAGSPKQLFGGLDTMDEVAAGKLVSLNKDYTQIPGNKGSLEGKLTPATLATFRAVQKRQSEGDSQTPAASGFVPKNGWQLSAPSGNPDVSTKGTNARFPNAVWTKDGPSGAGWYAKFGGQIGRVE